MALQNRIRDLIISKNPFRFCPFNLPLEHCFFEEFFFENGNEYIPDDYKYVVDFYEQPDVEESSPHCIFDLYFVHVSQED
jgi:hypothetical protein